MILNSKQHTVLKNIILCLALTVLTFFAFDLILENDFILYDDPGYVTENNHVLQSLTGDSISWAFQTTFTGNWIPVTWLSHMLDVELYGLNPKGHHLSSLLLHICNALLVFALFGMTTRKPCVSAAVAVLFAIHPLRVESVAWVSERKDVLSGFFGLAACISYVLYTRRKSVKKQGLFYTLTLILLTLGLMSKPMLVTWPFLFLVLDFWPLKRFRKVSTPQTDSTPRGPHIRRLFFEKIPFICLALIFSGIALYAQTQHAAVHTLESSPMNLRSANVVVSYARYLGKIFWPRDLSLLYPLDLQILAAPKVILSSAVLIVISLFCIFWKNKRPWLLAGWLWFVGALVPVIGLVQIGAQSIADRYTYLPSIGISVMAAFTLDEAARKGKLLRIVAIVLVACILSVLMVLTWAQCARWKNSITVFGHALKTTDNNYIMQMNYAYALLKAGRYDDALLEYQKASTIKPESAEPYLKCGIIYLEQEHYQQALGFFETALLKKNDIPVSEVYNNMGITYAKLKNYNKAVNYFQKAIKENPDNPETYKNLSLALLEDNKKQAARKAAREGLSLATADDNSQLAAWFHNFIQDLKIDEP